MQWGCDSQGIRGLGGRQAPGSQVPKFREVRKRAEAGGKGEQLLCPAPPRIEDEDSRALTHVPRSVRGGVSCTSWCVPAGGLLLLRPGVCPTGAFSSSVRLAPSPAPHICVVALAPVPFHFPAELPWALPMFPGPICHWETKSPGVARSWFPLRGTLHISWPPVGPRGTPSPTGSASWS